MKLSRYITVLYADSGLKICNYCLFLRKQEISVYPKDCMDYPLLSTTFKFILCSERKKIQCYVFSLYLTSAADLNSLVLLPGGLLWMPY